MQVTLRWKPHNTHTKGIDLSVRVTMSVQKKREGVLFMFPPLKRKVGGLIEDIRYFSVPVIIYYTHSQLQFSDEHAHPFRMGVPFIGKDFPYQLAFSPYLIPLESLFLFFLWLYHKGPLGVVAWTLSFIVVCHTQQRESKKLDWK